MEIELPSLEMVPADLEPRTDEALMGEGTASSGQEGGWQEGAWQEGAWHEGGGHEGGWRDGGGVGAPPEAATASDSRCETVEPFKDALSLGVPLSRALTAEGADDEQMAAFIEAESATHRYCLVNLACTLNPAEDVSIRTANLTCLLRRRDGGAGDPPIAMSMTPERVRDIEPLRTTSKLRLSFDLKIVSPSIEYERDRQGNAASDVVVAYCLQQPTPFWKLTRSEQLPLVGSYCFAVVVRIDRDAPAELMLRLDGQGHAKHLGLFGYSILLPPRLNQPFALP
ncbi:MAG TPA: hypothetical protein VMD59_21225 [Acidimicrobiales bacterium]|nr:hypothetical protein [Acidimicrobiales bacterium]